MKRFWFLITFLFSALPLLADEKISYAREILPILSENCLYCHGPDKEHRKEGLRLDVRAWDPENPPESEALIRIFFR
jgi:hypothetical protein